jgi:hypothetical protein
MTTQFVAERDMEDSGKGCGEIFRWGVHSLQPTMSYLKELGWVGEESELARSLIFLKFRPQSVLGRKMRAVVYDGGGDTTMIHSAG